MSRPHLKPSEAIRATLNAGYYSGWQGNTHKSSKFMCNAVRCAARNGHMFSEETVRATIQRIERRIAPFNRLGDYFAASGTIKPSEQDSTDFNPEVGQFARVWWDAFAYDLEQEGS